MGDSALEKRIKPIFTELISNNGGLQRKDGGQELRVAALRLLEACSNSDEQFLRRGIPAVILSYAAFCEGSARVGCGAQDDPIAL